MENETAAVSLLEAIKEPVTADRRVGAESTQILAEGDFIVPDVKPDIGSILKVDATAVIDKKELSADRVNFAGNLDINVLYLTKANAVCGMSFETRFEDFLNIDGITKEMWADVTAEITNVTYNALNERKVSYRVVIEISAKVHARTEHMVVTSIKGIPETQIRKQSLQISKTAEYKNETFSVKDEMVIPTGKPNVRELLKTTVTIANKDVKVTGGRVHINGELIISALYVGDGDEDGVIEFVEREAPFNGSIDAQNAREGMFCDATLFVAATNVRLLKDSDGEERVVEVETVIGASLKVLSQIDISALADAYCLDKNIGLVTETINYPRLVCRVENRSPVKEVVKPGDDCPDILQIFRITGEPVISEIKVVDDKTIVEGIVDTDILYIANNDTAPLYNFKAAVPFKQVIETRGAAPGMEAEIEKSVDHVAFNMLTDREMEIRFLLCLNTKVTENRETAVVTDVTFADMDKEYLDKIPAITVYVVQKGDSLWNIAKRYNANIDELMEVNELDSPDKITPGQKLLAIKRVSA